MNVLRADQRLLSRGRMCFADAWVAKHTPKTSRLVHGAGIVALGYVMEVLALLDGARRPARSSRRAWAASTDRTAWTIGRVELRRRRPPALEEQSRTSTATSLLSLST